MRGALPLLLILAAAATAEAQTQGSIDLSTETQIVQGSAARRLTQHTWEPDFGVLWTQPGRRFSLFQAELRGTRRGDELHLGRTWLALRDARARGVLWSLEGGDLYAPPSFLDYQFSNLSAPAITFTGGAVSAKSKSLAFQVVAGRSTAWRNIFGTDPDTLGQTVGLARASYRATPRLHLTARGSRVRTTDLQEFPRTIDDSDQAGGGMRFIVTPMLQLVADGAFVRYRATGSTDTINDYSALAGAHVLLSRGWVQVNASRYSPGDLPVLNASLQDRSGVFSAAEYDLVERVRLFGGWETLDTNINPSGTALQRPMAATNRRFGGVRLRVAARSTFTVRIEDGGRVSRPPDPNLFGSQLSSTTDTGSMTAELQTTAGRVTAFGRYTRRDSVDSVFTSSTYAQHDSAAQLFFNVSRETQLFGIVGMTTNRQLTGAGNSYLQLSAGAQQQLFKRGLWLRLEGGTSRSQDFSTGLLAPRETFSVGLNGQIAQYTTVGLNVHADRAPVGFSGSSPAWLTRSTLRVVHSIPTGSVRVANAAAGSSRGARGTGTVSGSVFADWNGNGLPDGGDEVLAGIPIALGSIAAVTTGSDGQFTFVNVPAGAQMVRLDLNALPVDFDPPAGTDVTVEIARGGSRRVAFGLLPLGAVRGRVIEDVNKNGQLDAGDRPIDNAVIVMDGGMRSEQARGGEFRFDAVRAGDHRIELLKESLPEGAAIVGDSQRQAAVTREVPQAETLFLITLEKRPEVRRVFPAKGGGGGAGAASAAPARGAGSRTARVAPTGAGRGNTAPVSGVYTIQVAAMADAANARALLDDLARAGFDAYLVAPAADADVALYRVRVGKYASRTSAQRVVARLEDQLGLKLWITKTR